MFNIGFHLSEGETGVSVNLAGKVLTRRAKYSLKEHCASALHARLFAGPTHELTPNSSDEKLTPKHRA